MTTADHDMVIALAGEYRAMEVRNFAGNALPSPWGPMPRKAGPAPSLSAVTEETIDDDYLSELDDACTPATQSHTRVVVLRLAHVMFKGQAAENSSTEPTAHVHTVELCT